MRRLLSALLGLACLAAAPAWPEVPEPDGRLRHIFDRGRLIVGVKTDYPPWGMIDPQGEIVGLEPDLARDLADRLGLPLELVPVTSANRLQRLDQGVIDILIATMSDTEERRRRADLLAPHYYSSGVTLLAPKNAPFTQWGQLRGRPVCLTDGAFFNRTLTEKYLIQPVIFRTTRDTLLALRDGHCIGMAYDDTVLTQTLANQIWSGYHLATPSILNSPWAIAIRKGEAERSLGRFVSDTVADWHRAGTVLALQETWTLPHSGFLQDLNAIWSAERDGAPVCVRGPEGAWPAECLSGRAIRTGGLEAEMPGWAEALRARTGLDLTFAFDRIDRDRLIRGIGLTLVLSLVAIAGSLAVGIGIALINRSLRPGLRLTRVLRLSLRGLVVGARMTPPILQLYILFFGLGGYLAYHYGYTPGSFAVAALVLSCYAGATNAVILRSAIAELQRDHPGKPAPKLLPAAIEQSYEGLVSTSVNIVKAAGLASTIALPETISTVNTIIAEGGNATTMMNLLLVFYFVFVLSVLGLLHAARWIVARWN